jgi:hypothetical protein
MTRIPSIAGSGPLRSLATTTTSRWARNEQAEFIKESEKTFKESGKPRLPYEYQATGKITYNSPRLVSVLFDSLQFTAGAHPMSYFNTFNFGMVDGKAKVMKLADFFAPGSDYKKRVSEAVIGKLKQKEGATEVTSGQVKTMTPEQLERFVAVPDGLMFLFDPYEVGPYASGRFQIKLTVNELGSNFKKALIFARTAPGSRTTR